MGKVMGVLVGLAIGSQALPAYGEPTRGAATQAKAASASQEPTPERWVRDRNAGARLGLLIAGSVVFAVTYGLPCAAKPGLWCVPFAGPVLVVAKREREQSGSADSGEDGIVPPAFVYMVAGGLGMLQLGGAAMITVGALLPRREVEEPAQRVTLLPVLSASVVGVAAVGTW